MLHTMHRHLPALHPVFKILNCHRCLQKAWSEASLYRFSWNLSTKPPGTERGAGWSVCIEFDQCLTY